MISRPTVYNLKPLHLVVEIGQEENLNQEFGSRHLNIR